MLGTIVGLIIICVVAGFIVRTIVPGAQLMSTSEKVAPGIAGSFVGGLAAASCFTTAAASFSCRAGSARSSAR